MATFSVIFYPRYFYCDSDRVYECAADLDVLTARVLGRADDLNGSFDSAADQFTDVIAWDIRGLSEEDLQNWRDAAVSVTYAATVAEMWADTVKAFHSERDAQISTWDGALAEKVGSVPSKYRDAHITSSYPQVDGWWFTDWGTGDEQRCRTLYDELVTVREGLITREQTNWQNLQDGADEVRTMLEQGPTPENVRTLMAAGNAGWAFFNIDPARYASLIEDGELTPENAEEFAGELNAYWSGDRPLDDRYHEIMLVLSVVGGNARQSQQNGTPLSDREMDFLEEFYAHLEEPYFRDGVGGGIMVYPDLMNESDMSEEEREEALGALGDGLLALSDPDLGGGYDMLPQSFVNAVEGPWINADSEGRVPSTPVGMGMDMKALSAFLAHTDEDMEGGYGLSTNLQLSTGAFLDAWGDVPDPDGVMPDSEQLSHILGAATRNEDANYYVLTGDHLNEEPGVEYGDKDLRIQALDGTLTYEWHDHGHTARQLTDWLAEDIHSEDAEVRQRAGDAFAGFMETVTGELHGSLVNTGVDVTEGDNEYSNASFTQFNGELADSFADIFDAHIYSFADSDVLEDNEPATGIGDFNADKSFVSMGAEERATYMQLLMGNDETAGRVVNSVDVYQQIEAAAFFGSGQDEETARGGGQLQALLEEALRRESADRSTDLDEQIDRETQIAEFVVGEAAGLSERIPVIGTAASKGLELGEESIVNAIIDGEYDVSPRHPTFSGAEFIERNFRIEALDYLSQNDPTTFNSVIRPDEFHTLIEGGAITVTQNGTPLPPEEIGEKFTFDETISIIVEKDPSKWSDNEDQYLDRMDSAISNIMDDVEITTDDGRTQPGYKRVDDFVTQYNNSYNDTNSAFGGEEGGGEK
ncbi:hypothetical protein [Nocardiopsis sp. CNT312]|uniref:TPR repeat region-containing protein n=1 Tax=Nocardiopsis sp. CNT312 TaxID=1137268 RepID=UPI00048D4799|nr:hypothetical protein [Nocardiopsis sp. CNT312]